jgi:hypothetical protein
MLNIMQGKLKGRRTSLTENTLLWQRGERGDFMNKGVNGIFMSLVSQGIIPVKEKQ